MYPLDGVVEVRFNNKVIYMTLRNNLEVQLPELFVQKWLLYLNFEFTTIGFADQGIGHNISFARGVMNIHVEIGYCLEPSLLAEIQVWLSEQVLQALVVGVDLATITDEVVSPQLQCINYCCQFEIMGWIIIFVRTQLTRAISNHLALLH